MYIEISCKGRFTNISYPCGKCMSLTYPRSKGRNQHSIFFVQGRGPSMYVDCDDGNNVCMARSKPCCYIYIYIYVEFVHTNHIKSLLLGIQVFLADLISCNKLQKTFIKFFCSEIQGQNSHFAKLSQALLVILTCFQLEINPRISHQLDMCIKIKQCPIRSLHMFASRFSN